jgi:hypothetical protein
LVARDVTFGRWKIHGFVSDGIAWPTLRAKEHSLLCGNDPRDGAAEDSFTDILILILTMPPL